MTFWLISTINSLVASVPAKRSPVAQPGEKVVVYCGANRCEYVVPEPKPTKGRIERWLDGERD